MSHSVNLSEALREMLLRGWTPPNHFNPPYESPIEQAFAWRARTTLREDLSIQKQAWVSTIGGRFRLDFLIEHNGRKVAFECDGKNFHDWYRDRWRDALILADAQCDVVYRLSGRDLWLRTDDLMYVLSRLEPQLFSERGHMNLRHLASRCVVEAEITAGEDVFISYEREEPDDDEAVEQDEVEAFNERLGSMRVCRRSLTRHSPLDDLASEYWNFALDHRGVSFDQLIAAWKREHPDR